MPESDHKPSVATEAVVLPEKRGPGRPKGLPKTGGRKPNGKNWTDSEGKAELSRLTFEFARDVLANEPIPTAGPTGKMVRRRPTLSERISVLNTVLARLVPTLTAATVDATVANKTEPLPDTRQLGRAVVALLQRARIADANPADEGEADPEAEIDALDNSDQFGAVAFPVPQDGPACFTSGFGRPATPAGNGEASPAPASAARNGRHFEIGARLQVGDAGHQIQLHDVLADGREKWSIYDGRSVHHGNRIGRENAERACEELISKGSMSP